MKIYKFFLVIFLISFLIDDRTLASFRVSQGILFIPVVLFYFARFRLPENKVLRANSIMILLLLLGELIVSRFVELRAAYAIMGGIVLVNALGNTFRTPEQRRELLYTNLVAYFVIFSIPILGYYLGFWHYLSDEDTTGRKSFMFLNANFIAFALVLDFIIGVYLLNILKTRWKRNAVIALNMLAVLPVLETVSRTNIFCLTVVLILWIIQYQFRRNSPIIKLFLGFFAVLLLLVVGTSKLENSEVFTKGAKRFNTVENEREMFRAIGLEQFAAHPLFGVGLDNFDDYGWRISVGFSMESDEELVSTATHNTYIDLLLIGGILLFTFYMTLVIYPTVIAVRKILSHSTGKQEKALAYFVFAINFIVLVNNYTSSNYPNKQLWWTLSMSYIALSLMELNKVAPIRKTLHANR